MQDSKAVIRKENFLNSLDYKKPSTLNPKKRETQQYYIALYKDYITGEYGTIKQMATRHGISDTCCQMAIKWAAQRLNAGMSKDEFKNDMLAQVAEVEDRLQRILDGKDEITPKNVKDMVMLLREIRLNKRFGAQLKGVLSTANIDNSDRRKITVITNDLGRRRGVRSGDTLKLEDKDDKMIISDAEVVEG